MGSWFSFARVQVVGDIDELVIELEPGVRLLELLCRLDHREVAQLVIAPPEELCDAGSCTSLLVKGDNRNT